MKILHIISYPRSRSLILGLAFGQYQERSYLGETPTVFTMNWDRNCGCSTRTYVHLFDFHV